MPEEKETILDKTWIIWIENFRKEVKEAEAAILKLKLEANIAELKPEQLYELVDKIGNVQYELSKIWISLDEHCQSMAKNESKFRVLKPPPKEET